MKKLTTQEFNALPKNKKVVLVAKDVLTQLNIKRYTANSGNYIKLPKFKVGTELEGQINKKFESLENCQVCALGSMLMSCTHLGNKLTFNDLNLNRTIGLSSLLNNKITSLFKSIFDNKTLLLIETSFEGYSNWKYSKIKDIKMEKNLFRYNERADRYSTERLTFEECYKCEMFFRKYKKDDSRLRAICNNLITNKGVFTP